MNTGTCKFLSELGIKTMEPCNCEKQCEKTGLPIRDDLAVPIVEAVHKLTEESA